MADDLEEELTLLRVRVSALEDREEIRQLTAEYMQAMHDARWEDALACFSDDACYDHGVLGYLPANEKHDQALFNLAATAPKKPATSAARQQSSAWRPSTTPAAPR